MKLTAYQIRKANMNGDNYSKQQHTSAPGFNAYEARWWNYYLPSAEQYTKAEHAAAPGFDADEACWWNEYFPNSEQYTKAEPLQQVRATASRAACCCYKYGGNMIKQISIITQMGAKTYEVGQALEGGTVYKIELGVLTFTGDPFAQYIGYDEAGKMLFNVDPMCPHECEYL